MLRIRKNARRTMPEQARAAKRATQEWKKRVAYRASARSASHKLLARH